QPPIQTHPLSLHDALPISDDADCRAVIKGAQQQPLALGVGQQAVKEALQTPFAAAAVRTETVDMNRVVAHGAGADSRCSLHFAVDRKSTRLNSSHVSISYA